MNLRTSIAATAVLVMALGGAATAGNGHGHGGKPESGAGAGHHDMMQNMMRMHSQMMGGHGSMPMMGDGMGMMRGGAGGHDMSMMRLMMQRLDADGDGTVTADEARDGLEALLSEYDADGDGTLSLSEFETMHSAIIRETVVDRFQFLDDDGDGQVTANEIVKPADHMERMQSMREGMMEERDMPDGTESGSAEHHDGESTSD